MKINFAKIQEAKRAGKLIKDRFGIDEIEEWMANVDYDNDGQLTYEACVVKFSGH